jgi:hypothetical protein
MLPDDEEARKDQAEQLRKAIDEATHPPPDTEGAGAEGPLPGESIHDFIRRKMHPPTKPESKEGEDSRPPQ